MASISNQIRDVLYGYQRARQQSLAGHPLAKTLRQDLPATIQDILSRDGRNSQLTARGSAGQGRWASVPWVAIFHADETSSAQNGIYIVYLFAGDGSTVFLTLNQGTSGVTSQELSSNRDRVQKLIHIPDGFLSGPLAYGSLRGPVGTDGHPYEVGCICYKAYPATRTGGDELLSKDLLALTDSYANYVRNIPPAVIEEQSGEPADDGVTSTDTSDHPVFATDDLRQRLLDRVRSLTPGAFERLLGRLWQHMGYTNVRVTGSTSDGGIDGDFEVPMLGVRIVLQAKRYAEGNNIGSPAIRQLRGSAGHYDRGLFVTTSTYTAGAREEAEDGGGVPLVLIDGEGLVRLLLDNRLGIKSIVERAELDESLFASLEA